MGGWKILAIAIAAIYPSNARRQKDNNTIIVSMFMEHNGNWNIAADT